MSGMIIIFSGTLMWLQEQEVTDAIKLNGTDDDGNADYMDYVQ